jgi:hypothetical protein
MYIYFVAINLLTVVKKKHYIAWTNQNFREFYKPYYYIYVMIWGHTFWPIKWQDVKQRHGIIDT